MKSEELLINQIDAFIRKYYKNQMLRGSLLFVLLLALSFLLVTGLEYIGRFDSVVRLVLLVMFIGLNGIILFHFFITPLSKLFSFGKRINRYQAAQIIGSFFPEVNDKLLNTLQLNDLLHEKSGNVELLQASISQSSKSLSLLSFPSAIKYGENKKYLFLLLPIFIIFSLIAWFLPSFFTESTERLIKYNQVFVEPAPFEFELLNKDLIIEEGEAFDFSVKIHPKKDGEIPNRIYLVSSQGRFLMDNKSLNVAHYVLSKIKSDVDFYFEANGFRSEANSLKVFGRSNVRSFSAELNFPSYLSMKNQIVENINDLAVPEGTIITWSGNTKNTDKVFFVLKDTTAVFGDKGFQFRTSFKRKENLIFSMKNKFSNRVDSSYITVDVIKDAYPSVSVNETQDSIRPSMRLLSGVASDDHGIRNVDFVYKITRKDGSVVEKKKAVPGISGTKSSFFLRFDINSIGLELEDDLKYWFVVYDNDGINGSKSSKSSLFAFKVPSRSELEKSRQESKESAKKELEELKRKRDEFRQSMDQLRMDILNAKQPSWKEQQQLEQIKEQQKNLRDRMNELNESLKNSFDEKQNLSPADEKLLEQQELLEELLNDVMDEELQKLLEQLEELLNEQQKDGYQELFEEMDIKSEDASRQMDRTMEMLKRLDVEERSEAIEKSLEELAQDQMDLSENDELSLDEKQEKQTEINDRFEELKDQMQELKDKNDELKRPFDLDNLKEDQQDITDELNEASEKLDKGKDKKAKENQQNASDKMEQMSSKMNAMMQSANQQQQQEDIEALRSLLENLLKSSFDQEFVMEAFKNVSATSPTFVSYGREQRSIIDNFRVVEDSLRALADRIPKISSFVNKELADIEKNFRAIPDDIDERRQRDLGIKQQLTMTSINNLALFLNESLQNMQADMQGDMQGSGSCDNPGGKGKGSEGDELQNMKDMLKKQLEQMQKGESPGGKEPGQNEGHKLPFGNKEAAQMAAQQKAMRKRLEELRNEKNQDGSGKGEELNDLLKELDKQEENLINKRWDDELINRQREILTRLLESEKALEEREFDEQRESFSGKDEDFSNQFEFLEYKKLKEKQLELLRSSDPNFARYYRDRANEFLLFSRD